MLARQAVARPAYRPCRRRANGNSWWHRATSQPLIESLLLYQDLGDQSHVADAVGLLGSTEYSSGPYGGPKQRYKESLAICCAVDGREGIARATADLASVAVDKGRLEQTGRLAREGCERAQEPGDTELYG